MNHKIKKDIEAGVNPRDYKLKLAQDIVKTYHGEDKAKQAHDNFIKTFSKKEVPDDVDEVGVPYGTPLGLLLQNEKIVASQAEFKRLVREGAVNTTEGEEIKDFNYQVIKPILVKVGKRRFLSIKVTP